ncbi:MAG: hypothetical protein P1U85_23115, partial [Verrucomicrobiales bacterium]|nr:hypothetical protein [Verrucomicrobiales bacterium]
MRNPTSHSLYQKRQKEQGSVLVICMVLAGLGTIGVAAWIALLDARGNQVEAQIAAVKQRAAERNSQALAHRALYANHLPSATATTADVTYQLPHNLGSCTIKGYSAAPLRNASSIRVSRNGATPVRSYTTDVTVTLPNGTGTQDWQYQMRSFNPILGGDLLSLHPPLGYDETEPLLYGNLTIEGRALFWDAIKDDFPASFKADEIILPNEILGTTQFENSAGQNTLPLNYPIARQTTGIGLSATPYEGKVDIFESSPNDHNSYEQRISASGISESVDAQGGQGAGAGPTTRPPSADAPEARALIATRAPSDLVSDLVRFYPLSSAVLQEVFDKSDTPFNADQLYQVLSAQGNLATDSLVELESNQDNRLNPDDLRALHEANQTVYVSNGSGRVKIFLNRPGLPHLVLRNVVNLEIVGQANDSLDSQASNRPARMLLVLNDSSTTLSELTFFEKNARRIVLDRFSEVFSFIRCEYCRQ